MLADNTRPRAEQMAKGVTLRSRRLLSVVGASNSLVRNDGPQDVGELVVKIANRLVSRMTEFINDVDDQVDELKNQVLDSAGKNVQTDRWHPAGRKPLGIHHCGWHIGTHHRHAAGAVSLATLALAALNGKTAATVFMCN